MKKLIAGIVMSALLFMALAVPASAEKWGSRYKNSDSTSTSSDTGVNNCGGGQASRWYYDTVCIAP